MLSSIIANRKEQSCYEIASGNFANVSGMLEENQDRALIQALVAWSGLSASKLATEARLAVSTITRPLNHDVNFALSLPTLTKLKKRFPDFPGWATDVPDDPIEDRRIDYVAVDVLPTYAGMGAGGTGDGEPERALIPRYLIEQVFRGIPSDFVLIRVRGDSMEPTFRHDDEILVDKRDRSPTQPGPFALWDAEWGEYLVKNVERLPGGRVRLFSTNANYSASEVLNEETSILGRPVWFGRRL